ncbi:MAG: DUF4836 family protein [Prevotellaceae bacterium]|nr:DUF4836 family protein [Prevotellaceae bacterium]
MRRKWYYVGGGCAAVAAVCLVLWLCLRPRGGDCSSALPKEATLVARIDLRGLLEQGGISEKGLPLMADKELATGGIDLCRPSYGFVCRGYCGAVVPLSDRDAFLRQTAELHGKVSRQGGLRWTVFGGSWLVALDREKLVAIGPATTQEQEGLRELLASCMRQKSTEVDGELLKALGQRQEPVCFATNGEMLPESLTACLKAALPEGVTLGDFALSAGLRAEDGALTLRLNVDGRSKKARAFLTELDSVLRPIDTYMPACEQPFLHLEAGLSGERLLELLRGNPRTRTALLAANMAVDLDMAVKSIDGDISLTMPTFALFEAQVAVQAELRDSAFMGNIKDWTGLKIVPARNDFYLCSYRGAACYFGLLGGRLVVTNAERYTLAPALASPLPKEAQGQKVYAALDFSGISELLTFLPGQRSLSKIETLTLSSKDVREWTLTLRAGQGEDLLRYLLKGE